MGVSKNRGVSPQIIHFNRDSHYKPSILGYHYFWKYPYIQLYIYVCIYICVCGPFLNTRFVSQCSLLVMKTRHLFEKTKELQDFLACLKGG